MFRVFDVSRCHPPGEPFVFFARKRISFRTSRTAVRTFPWHSFPVRCSSRRRDFFVPMQRDETSFPDIHDFVGSMGQPARD
jgi:hypothetical protein